MLADIAYLSEIFGTLAVFAGILFGVVQLRQFQQQRRDALAVELMHSIQDVEFTQSLRIVLAAPKGLSGPQFIELGQETEQAAWALLAKYETLGYLVYRRIMPIEMVEELVGGLGVSLWHQLRPWILHVREHQNQPLLLEWFQWLAERLEERGRPAAVPAHIRFGNWKPDGNSSDA